MWNSSISSANNIKMKMTLFSKLYSSFLFFCVYFCLWAISHYLLQDALLALLFFPFAFRLGVLLHSPTALWFGYYVAEWLVLGLIQLNGVEPNYAVVYPLSLVSLPCLYYVKSRYVGLPYQQFLRQLTLAVGLALLNAVGLWFFHYSVFYLFLISITGAVLLLPICFLLENYLFKHHWTPVTVNLVHRPIELRLKYIVIYLLIYSLNIYLQLHLPEEFARFLLLSLALPVLLLAFHYGWQGALLGTSLNSIALIATTHNFSGLGLSDLLLSLLAQTSMGILLGLGVAYLRELNQGLSVELARNKSLTYQLITNEENIRKAIARELHDEIGQNITAIRMQSTLFTRFESSPKSQAIAKNIDHLSLNIYDTIKNLLQRIRPKELDDLDLQQAIEQLFLEFNLEAQHIQVQFDWQNPKQLPLDHLLEITLYRLCQEGLNNIIKYARASKVKIALHIAPTISLSIEDNGVGFDPTAQRQGFGLRGMQERVHILGGTFQLHSVPTCTQIQITLPIDYERHAR